MATPLRTRARRARAAASALINTAQAEPLTLDSGAASCLFDATEWARDAQETIAGLQEMIEMAKQGIVGSVLVVFESSNRTAHGNFRSGTFYRNRFEAKQAANFLWQHLVNEGNEEEAKARAAREQEQGKPA